MSGFAFAGYRLDVSKRELSHGGAAVALPARAFDCLVFLLARRDRAVGRDELIEAMWGGRAATDVQLAQLILQCRRAIGDDGQAQRAIRTVPGYGYRWVLPLDAPATEPDASADGATADNEPAHDPADAIVHADDASPAQAGPTTSVLPDSTRVETSTPRADRDGRSAPDESTSASVAPERMPPARGDAQRVSESLRTDTSATSRSDEHARSSAGRARASGAGAAADADAADAGDRARTRRDAPPPQRRRTGAIAAALALIMLVALIAVVARERLRARPPAQIGRALVLPLRIDGDDAAWLRLGGLDVIVERLRRNRVPVLSSEASVALLQSVPVDAAAPLPVRSLRAAADANVVLAVRVHQAGTRWRLEAELADGEAAPRRFDGEGEDPIATLRALADRVSGALGQPVAEPAAAAANPALEITLQQARAALLANEPDRARAILMADATLVRDEPLLRQQLADVDIRAGRYAPARAALDALIARAPADARQRAQLFNSRGLVSVREGRFADAGADFGAAIDTIGRDGDAVTLGRAHLGRGISRTSLQDYGGALADDAQAREAFERAGDVGSVARVDSNLGALEILRGHMALAQTYLARALARFRDLGFVQEQVNTLQLTFVATRAQLERAAAGEAIDALDALRERIVSPSSRWSTGLYRAEWLIWNGRLAGAGAELEALAASAQPAAAAEAERLHLLRALLARSAGRADEALAELAGIADDVRDSADDDSVRADVTLLRARLHRDLGLGADTALPVPATIATPNPRTPLRLLAQADGLVGGDDEAAERAFAAALDLADEQGVAATLAAVVVDYANYLLDRGRADEATALAGRIALWAGADFECALLRLRLAHAKRDAAAWSSALDQARRLAGERAIPPALLQPPR